MRFLLLTAAPAALFLASGAEAQTSPAPPVASDPVATSTVDDVVVTARKQVENVQSVAATVQVVSAERLAAAGLTSFSDITKVVPSINIGDSPSANQFAVTIRGLGSAPGNQSFDNSVATYVDSAFLGRDREFGASLFDMASLETISGTQAALLGKNSSLGAINLVTRKPNENFGYNLLYQHEFELGSDRIEAGVTMPVSETLKLRLAGVYNDQGGPVRDVISGERYRDRDTGARLTAVWTPSDTVDVTAAVQVTRGETEGPRARAQVYGPAPALIAAYFGYAGRIPSGYDEAAQFSPALGYGQRESLDTERAFVTLNSQIGPGTLTSQTAYVASRTTTTGNYSYLPGNALITDQPDRSDQFSQEIRYSASLGPRFDYVGGLFYLHSRYKVVVTQSADFPAGSTPLPFPISGTASTYFNQTNEAFSAFGQGNYQISDQLKLALGLRYTLESKDVVFSRTTIVPGVFSTLLNPPVAPFGLSNEDGSLDGSIGLNWAPRDNVMIYSTWGQGTKAGGYAATVSNLRQSFYEPEVARTGELGVKSQFFGRALTLNASVFHTDVKNFQVVAFNGQNFVVVNQDVESNGFESQFSLRPAAGLRLYWNNIYADAHDPETGIDTPFAPRWSGLAGGSYERTIGGYDASIDVNVDYRSEQNSQTILPGSTDLLAPLEAINRLNLTLRVGDAARGWDLRLIGQNLTDERASGFRFKLPFVTSPPGSPSTVEFPLDPMTIKLQLSFRM